MLTSIHRHIETSELSGDDNLDAEEVANQIQELHSLSAHLQRSKDIIVSRVLKSVDFVLENPNPAMQAPPGVNQAGDDISDQTDSEMRKALGDELRECETLLLEIGRLERKCEMMGSRLKNAVGPVSVTFDSRYSC